jgi:hypothetical protein
VVVVKKGHAKFQWIQRDHDDGVRFIVDTPLEEAFATLTVALKDAAVRTDEKAASRDALSAVIDFVISTLGFEMARPLWLIEIENRAPRVGNPMNKAAESSLALCLAMVDLKSTRWQARRDQNRMLRRGQSDRRGVGIPEGKARHVFTGQ